MRGEYKEFVKLLEVNETGREASRVNVIAFILFIFTSYSIHIKVNFISFFVHTIFQKQYIKSSPYPRLISHLRHTVHPHFVLFFLLIHVFFACRCCLAIHISSNLHFKRISKQIASPFFITFFILVALTLLLLVGL